MENLLRSKDYWSLVEAGIHVAAEAGVEETEAQRKAREDARVKDLKVKNYLFQAIDRTIMESWRPSWIRKLQRASVTP